jgi:hypothetical protein
MIFEAIFLGTCLYFLHLSFSKAVVIPDSRADAVQTPLDPSLNRGIKSTVTSGEPNDYVNQMLRDRENQEGKDVLYKGKEPYYRPDKKFGDIVVRDA